MDYLTRSERAARIESVLLQLPPFATSVEIEAALWPPKRKSVELSRYSGSRPGTSTFKVQYLGKACTRPWRVTVVEALDLDAQHDYSTLHSLIRGLVRSWDITDADIGLIASLLEDDGLEHAE